MKTNTILVLMTLSAPFATACAAEGEGTLETRIYGEAFVEEGIPADAFVDGWAVTFSSMLVAVDGVSADGVEDPGVYVFELTEPSGGEGHAVGTLVVPEGPQQLDYRIAPGGGESLGNAPDPDAAMMEGMGYSVFVAGTATRLSETISFAWGFDTDTAYADCEVVADVPADGRATTVMTIHADHFFYDDLESPEPNVAFDLVAAADADMDGTVTADELRAQDISAEARYQVGSRPIDNLWDFIAAQSQTLGHIDGEGHCEQ